MQLLLLDKTSSSVFNLPAAERKQGSNICVSCGMDPAWTFPNTSSWSHLITGSTIIFGLCGFPLLFKMNCGDLYCISIKNRSDTSGKHLDRSVCCMISL